MGKPSIYTLAALLLALAGCGAADMGKIDPRLLESKPTYEAHIKSIYARYCVSCHDGRGADLYLPGGIELDNYENAYSTRVPSACVSISQELVDQFAAVLMPVPRDPPVNQGPCSDWLINSMPTGAKSPLTPAEQIILVRWVQTGAPER